MVNSRTSPFLILFDKKKKYLFNFQIRLDKLDLWHAIYAHIMTHFTDLIMFWNAEYESFFIKR